MRILAFLKLYYLDASLPASEGVERALALRPDGTICVLLTVGTQNDYVVIPRGKRITWELLFEIDKRAEWLRTLAGRGAAEADRQFERIGH